MGWDGRGLTRRVNEAAGKVPSMYLCLLASYVRYSDTCSRQMMALRVRFVFRVFRYFLSFYLSYQLQIYGLS